MTLRSVVKGTGSALPERRVDNQEPADRVETSDEWIVERTGIRSRYIAADGETTATLAVLGARLVVVGTGGVGDHLHDLDADAGHLTGQVGDDPGARGDRYPGAAPLVVSAGAEGRHAGGRRNN